MKNEMNLESKSIRDDLQRARLFCMNCGKIVSNLLPLDRVESWIELPFCFECITENKIKWKKVK